MQTYITPSMSDCVDCDEFLAILGCKGPYRRWCLLGFARAGQIFCNKTKAIRPQALKIPV